MPGYLLTSYACLLDNQIHCNGFKFQVFSFNDSKIFPDQYLFYCASLFGCHIGLNLMPKLNSSLCFLLMFFLLCFPSQYMAPLSAQFVKVESLATCLTSLMCSLLLSIQPPTPTLNKKEPKSVHLYPPHCQFPSTGHNDLLHIDHFNTL